MFPAYSPTTATTIYGVAPGFRPATVQQYSLNVQTELRQDWLLEVGYVGTRGEHLVAPTFPQSSPISLYQRSDKGSDDRYCRKYRVASSGVGVPPDSLRETESEGSSWYNGLEVSLTKRLGHGLQFLASYTFSKTLDTDGADINSTSANNALTLGDQNSPNSDGDAPASTGLIDSLSVQHGISLVHKPDSNGSF